MSQTGTVPDAELLEIIRGDGRDYVFDIYNEVGAAVALTGATITFRVRTGVGGTQLFVKTVGSGIVISSSPTNRCTVTVAAADTSTAAPGDYRYDLEVTLSSIPITTNYGTFSIIGDVA